MLAVPVNHPCSHTWAPTTCREARAGHRNGGLGEVQAERTPWWRRPGQILPQCASMVHAHARTRTHAHRARSPDCQKVLHRHWCEPACWDACGTLQRGGPVHSASQSFVVCARGRDHTAKSCLWLGSWAGPAGTVSVPELPRGSMTSKVQGGL